MGTENYNSTRLREKKVRRAAIDVYREKTKWEEERITAFRFNQSYGSPEDARKKSQGLGKVKRSAWGKREEGAPKKLFFRFRQEVLWEKTDQRAGDKTGHDTRAFRDSGARKRRRQKDGE